MSPAPSHLPGQDAVKGGLYMGIAMAAFTVNDTLVKLLAGELPVGTLVFVRGAVACVLMLAAIGWTGAVASLPRIFSRDVALRAALDVAATLLFITVLMEMPIAELTSITQSVPLVVTLLAVAFLGERVGWRRAAAIGLGFVGVVLIVKPVGGGLGRHALLALMLVLAVALRDIVTRRIHGSVPALIVALANGLFVLAGALALSFTEGGLRMPDASQLACLAAAGGFVAVGYLFMVQTLRFADVSASAPFRYTVVVWALLSGALVFGDWPDAFAFTGIVLIVASGLYTLHREARLRQAGQIQEKEYRQKA